MKPKKTDTTTAAPQSAYTVHPAAALFPMLDKASHEALKESIKARGVLVPAIMQGSLLIDGRNRMFACEELGIKCPVEQFDTKKHGDDIAGFIIAQNIERRHLTEDMRVMLVAKVRALAIADEGAENQKAGQFGKGGAKGVAKAPKGKTVDKLAKEAKTTQHKAKQAVNVVKNDPGAAEAIIAGKKKLSDASKEAKKKAAAAKPPKAPKPALPLAQVAVTKFVKWFEKTFAVVDYPEARKAIFEEIKGKVK